MFKFSNKKNSTSWFVVISLIAFLIFGLLFLYFSSYMHQDDSIDQLQDNAARILDISDDPFITFPAPDRDNLTSPVIDGTDPVWGKQGAPVQIVYYSDYDCQYCGEQIEMIRSAIKDYANTVKVIWKDYPDTDKGSFSYQASLAGRCAQEQDKFWEFESSFMDQFPVFKVQQGKNHDAFRVFLLGIATELNMKEDKFEDCFANQDAVPQIQKNILEAESLGLPGVPFTFINQQEVLGQYSLEELQQMINRELDK